MSADIVKGAIEPIVFYDLSKYNITIDTDQIEDIPIFCSPMLKQHIYNLVNNSLYSIEKRIASGDRRAGYVKISVKNESETDRRKEVNYNQRCLLSIWDNGLGVSEDLLGRLRQFRYGVSTKLADGGSGYGLYAAHEYVVNMLGVMQLDSVQGQYFQVKIWLDRYVPEIHDVLVTEMGGIGVPTRQ
jgi:signal transduction histidine kinase